MANISDKIAQIRQAIFGKDVRESIASGIEAIDKQQNDYEINLTNRQASYEEGINTRQDNVETRQTSLENVFDAEIQNLTLQDPSSAEIVQARTKEDGTTYPVLKIRLDGIDSSLAQNVQQISDLETNKADKTEVNSLATNKAEKTEVAALDLKKADQAFVDSQFASIVSGAPKGTYSTLSALQTAYPNGVEGVFLVLADGHWYYWNSTTLVWTDGGVYQAKGIALGSIGDNETIFPLVRTIRNPNLFNKETVTVGKYVQWSSGNLLTPSSDPQIYTASDFIKIKPWTYYTIEHQNQIAFYDINQVFISGIGINGDNTFITPSNAEYIRITTLNSYLPTQLLIEGKSVRPFINGSDVLNGSLKPEKINGYMKGKNLFDKNNIILGSYVSWYDGIVKTNVNYFASDFIEVEPNTEYTRPRPEQVAFYDLHKTFISGIENTKPSTFLTPSNAKYVRVSDDINNLNSYQLEKGNTPTTYESYETYYLKNLKVKSESQAPETNTQKIFNFHDAWVSWLNGEKFPIALYGDSTVDGVNTTGYVANILGHESTNDSAFSKLLENKLREATGNNILRIYNAGFSGKTASWGVDNINAEFTGSSAYNDVKMIGIGFGINDRLGYTKYKSYKEDFKSYIEQMINWCYDNNIQPFLLTTQAILSPGVSEDYTTQYPLRTAQSIETIANEVKRELAIKYNLEIIDVNKFTEKFLMYSQYNAEEIISDKLHFTDIGHKYESGLLFSHINPMAIIIRNKTKIDYSNQRLIKGVPENKLSFVADTLYNFKVSANYIKEDTIDTLIFKSYIFIDTINQMTLKAYKTDLSSVSYVKIDGVITTLDALENTIEQLDLGLHTLEAWTGESSAVDFKGFILE
ncbi:MAG: SGNH/GDSL hydrolase family protein [Clostridium lundense]|nr:SGNH/GDSL hydrolase family protein [Clostridium lundense]